MRVRRGSSLAWGRVVVVSRLCFVEGLDIGAFGRWLEGDAMVGRCENVERKSKCVFLNRSIRGMCWVSKREKLEMRLGLAGHASSYHRRRR